jgi:hypothetical protein
VSRAERRREEIVAEISRLPLAVPGSITERMTRCQRPGCHCKADPPQLHGPYPTWTRRENGTTITRTLHDEDTEQLRSCLDTHRRLRQLLTELETVSAQIAEQSLTTHRQTQPPGNQHHQTGI